MQMLCPLCDARNSEALPSGLYECLDCGAVFSKAESIDREGKFREISDEEPEK